MRKRLFNAVGKSFASAILCGTALLSTAFPVSAASQNNMTTQTKTITSDFKDQNGNALGMEQQVITYVRSEKNSDITVTITDQKHYDILASVLANRPELKTQLADSQTVTTVTATKDKKYFVNGKQLTKEELGSGINQSGTVSPMSDTGGVPSICHYYDANDYYNYHFACYSGMTIGGDPSGSNIQRDTTINNVYYTRAADVVDIFSGDYTNFEQAELVLSEIVAIAPFTVETVVGLIAAGGAAGIQAAIVYSDYNTCNGDLSKAYGYISQM